jgi:hypothetical protein
MKSKHVKGAPHGTTVGYLMWKCRCERCVLAGTGGAPDGTVCQHRHTIKETISGQHTGDRICESCEYVLTPGE